MLLVKYLNATSIEPKGMQGLGSIWKLTNWKTTRRRRNILNWFSVRADCKSSVSTVSGINVCLLINAAFQHQTILASFPPSASNEGGSAVLHKSWMNENEKIASTFRAQRWLQPNATWETQIDFPLFTAARVSALLLFYRLNFRIHNWAKIQIYF